VKLIANGVEPEYAKRRGYLRWLEDGLEVRAIQLLLGHAKLEITRRYLNITDVGVVRSMRELSRRPAYCEFRYSLNVLLRHR